MSIDPALLSRLVSAARTAQRRAYAPYSNFHVGAALYTDRGRIVGGCNVENASYGLTNCAERVAIGRTVADGAGTPMVCVVVGPKPEALLPCGACRQVLVEFNPDMQVICFGTEGEPAIYTARELLPSSFDAAALDGRSKP